MKIQKAIEIIHQQHEYLYHHANPDIKDALKLGIEALTRLQTLRQDPRLSPAAPLPSETED